MNKCSLKLQLGQEMFGNHSEVFPNRLETFQGAFGGKKTRFELERNYRGINEEFHEITRKSTKMERIRAENTQEHF